MNFKILAVLAVSFALIALGIIAFVAGNYLAAVPCGWMGMTGLLLTFNHCAGTRNKEIDEEEYERSRRSTKQAA